MAPDLTSSKAALRDALSGLKPTGADGFEGLIAGVLSAATGYVFRLAAAGTQGGRDGGGHGTENHIAFEAKLYGSTLPRNEVLAKIPLLLASAVPIDLWILAASCEVRAQIGETLESMRTHGLATLILDWPDHIKVPPLLAALMIAPEVTTAFLAEHGLDVDLEAIKTALSVLEATAEAQQAILAVRAELEGPALGLGAALKSNNLWLRKSFSDRRAAWSSFGQALAPAATIRLSARGRPGVDPQIDAALERRLTDITIIIGPEGTGKSWAVALRWLAAENPPLTLFVPAASISTPLDEPGAIEALLVARLLEQTGDFRAPGAAERWQRRLSAWRRTSAGDRPRLVLVIDGLNENPARNWALLLDRLAIALEEYGANLIVTSREKFFTLRIKTGLITKAVICPLREWTRAELGSLLTELGIDASLLAYRVINALLNPRLLGIAVQLLDAGDLRAAEEISRERLLFEHIRQLGNASERRPELFIRSLSDHAASILAGNGGAKASLVFDTVASHTSPRTVYAELDAVVGERYFTALPDDPTRYVLTEDGLSMALGVAIVRSLADVARCEGDIYETLDRLLEPVAALDRMTEAMSAALLIVSIDVGPADAVRIALVRGYLRLQNVDERSYRGFAAAIRSMPVAGLEALKVISQGVVDPPRLRWLTLALRAARQDSDSAALVIAHARTWLQLYSLKPDRNADRHNPRPDGEKRRVEEQEKHEAKIAALSPAERTILARLERNDTIDPARLAAQAIILLAGLPLASLVEDLVGWTFASTLNISFSDPDKEFAALIRFNRVDFTQARTALLRAAEPLMATDVSLVGKWALVSLLRATGTLNDAEREAALVDGLVDRSEWPKSWRLMEDYCATDPCDPQSQQPENLQETVERYRAIPVEKLAAGRMTNEHDHFLDDGATSMARFAPEAAIEMHRAHAVNVLGRTGEPLRMGVFDLDGHGALLHPLVPELLGLSQALYEDTDVEDLQKSHIWIVQQMTLLGAFLHLDGDAQVEALRNLPPHGPLLIQFNQVFRPASSQSLHKLLGDALESGSENRILAALAFA